MSQVKYFKNIIDDNQKDFKKYLKLLKMNYPTKKIFSYDQLEINRLRIQEFLNPVQGLSVYFSEYKKNILKLNISNLQRLPVEIIGLELKDGKKIQLTKPLYLEGKNLKVK